MKTPQRKPDKFLSIEEMKQKAEKLAGVIKTPEQTLEEIAKNLK